MADTAQEINLISTLIAQLLPTILNFGIPAVENVIGMIKNDHNIPASALQAAIAQRLTEAAKNDQAILAESK